MTTNPHTVLVGLDSLKSFVAVAHEEYEACSPHEPPSCFAVLLGTVEDGTADITSVEFATNVRATDPAALKEFAHSVTPCFGSAYANSRRGFWCAPGDLLRLHRQAEREGTEVLGSLHLHPDWHRIGPPGERGLRISEEPTPMDRYMFDNTRYPVNMICYLESGARAVSAALAAWGPPPEGRSDAPCPRLALRFRLL
ncbi:hypothetical protein LUX12_03270 [Streptomyces somaliensis]|uniref:hypothetical protein n=1 Tax=Streptomyces somaliensis TaxID=78355 RepID=UPI0020CB9994|nr:hypothetical protein [Streptomyces somaliensis]MCP9944029.1 hypothetical protein [Streptomyces somaliensis]MCP9962732.1 hypothetical protein [Streptomyces somaliensis]MCP9975567.1 hypothetical protein [Streptomyces somaliensis]